MRAYKCDRCGDYQDEKLENISTRKRCESCGHVALHGNVVYFSVEEIEVVKDD
jgi:DNA-directed RNA polymerase subunit RPC12/RpoP